MAVFCDHRYARNVYFRASSVRVYATFIRTPASRYGTIVYRRIRNTILRGTKLRMAWHLGTAATLFFLSDTIGNDQVPEY